jgi:DNA-binding response OmpR family regulator
MSKARIVIAEDDDNMALGLQRILEREGHTVARARDGVEAARLVKDTRPDLLVLDIMMPLKDGLSVIRELRGRGDKVAILVLSAKGMESDKVLGLELGADDYLVKPFSIAELVARVNVQLRRGQKQAARPARVKLDVLDIDFDSRQVSGPNGGETLSTYENGLLGVLVGAAGETVSRRQLLEEIWGDDSAVTNRVVDFHVTNLRRKLAALTGQPEPRLLLTVHGTGYKLVMPNKT